MGCSFLAEAVKAKCPKLHVFGHVHTDPLSCIVSCSAVMLYGFSAHL